MSSPSPNRVHKPMIAGDCSPYSSRLQSLHVVPTESEPPCVPPKAVTLPLPAADRPIRHKHRPRLSPVRLPRRSATTRWPCGSASSSHAARLRRWPSSPPLATDRRAKQFLCELVQRHRRARSVHTQATRRVSVLGRSVLGYEMFWSYKSVATSEARPVTLPRLR
eukprot:6175639-Pleurochrysis_carterae.AAC.3